MPADLTAQTTELLQTLIRNECVNDGTPDSGHETRNADVLTQVLEGGGLDVARYESRPGRGSVVARIEGTDPDAPSLCLCGHLDVVPVNPDGWSRDPFGGELVDGEVWGRGAVDMLNLTSSMAVAFRHLADTGFRPKGDLIYLGVADEEAGGAWGAEWMAEHHWDEIGADYLLTEFGGYTVPGHDGRRHVTVSVAEKGLAWRRLKISGTPGHGSVPFRADNAVVKAAEIVRRLADYRPAAHLTEMWRGLVETLPMADDQRAALLDTGRLDTLLDDLPQPLAARCHAETHTTFSPNVVVGGQKTNIIPDTVVLDVDIRVVPGETADEVDGHLRAALGHELFEHVELTRMHHEDPTSSPTGTPLWDVLEANVRKAYPDADLYAGLITGATDARFYRRRGSIAYGAGLLSPAITMSDFGSRFHGHDERIDVDSLGLTTDLWLGVARDLLG